MPVDWSKYPPLPEPPTLPEWRDTPEREALWKEMAVLSDPTSGKTGERLFAAVLLADAAISVWWIGPWNTVMSFLILLGFIPPLVIWFIAAKIWRLAQEMRAARRYGMVYMLKPKYRNIDPEIRAILTDRPEFDPAEFRKYWPSAESADMAEKILKIASHYWYPSGKMFYPNDPLHLLFFGKPFFFTPSCKSVAVPDEFYEDIVDEFNFAEWEKLSVDSPLAELVNACLETIRNKIMKDKQQK